jgi:hypothetical protein
MVGSSTPSRSRNKSRSRTSSADSPAPRQPVHDKDCACPSCENVKLKGELTKAKATIRKLRKSKRSKTSEGEFPLYNHYKKGEKSMTKRQLIREFRKRNPDATEISMCRRFKCNLGTIKRWQYCDDLNDRPRSGCPPTVCTPENVRVTKLVGHNGKFKQRNKEQFIQSVAAEIKKRNPTQVFNPSKRTVKRLLRKAELRCCNGKPKLALALYHAQNRIAAAKERLKWSQEFIRISMESSGSTNLSAIAGRKVVTLFLVVTKPPIPSFLTKKKKRFTS